MAMVRFQISGTAHPALLLHLPIFRPPRGACCAKGRGIFVRSL